MGKTLQRCIITKFSNGMSGSVCTQVAFEHKLLGFASCAVLAELLGILFNAVEKLSRK